MQPANENRACTFLIGSVSTSVWHFPSGPLLQKVRGGKYPLFASHGKQNYTSVFFYLAITVRPLSWLIMIMFFHLFFCFSRLFFLVSSLFVCRDQHKNLCKSQTITFIMSPHMLFLQSQLLTCIFSRFLAGARAQRSTLSLTTLTSGELLRLPEIMLLRFVEAQILPFCAWF